MCVSQRQRSVIACYWESQPSGCLKAHCPFLHSKPRPNHKHALQRLGEFKLSSIKINSIEDLKEKKEEETTQMPNKDEDVAGERQKRLQKYRHLLMKKAAEKEACEEVGLLENGHLENNGPKMNPTSIGCSKAGGGSGGWTSGEELRKEEEGEEWSRLDIPPSTGQQVVASGLSVAATCGLSKPLNSGEKKVVCLNRSIHLAPVITTTKVCSHFVAYQSWDFFFIK